MSVDVQLHILSPLLLFWVLRGRLSAWSSFTIGLVAALTANIVYCFLNDFSDGYVNFEINVISIKQEPILISIDKTEYKKYVDIKRVPSKESSARAIKPIFKKEVAIVAFIIFLFLIRNLIILLS